MKTLSNFPKIECPFIRKTFKVNKEDWKKYGRELELRSPDVYLVIDEINPGYEWVFEDKDVIATEKLNGTNVRLETEGGRLVALMNRKNVIDPLQIMKGKTFIIEGVFRAIQKGYIKENGLQDGEVIGPKLQSNPYNLDNHIWYPFLKAIDHLSYRSFYKHERTLDNWSSWFKDYLISRFATKYGKKEIMAEGIVFYNLKRKEEGKTYMAKLRRNMFDWFYSNKIEIYRNS
jgi:hypothetical protein